MNIDFNTIELIKYLLQYPKPTSTIMVRSTLNILLPLLDIRKTNNNKEKLHLDLN